MRAVVPFAHALAGVSLRLTASLISLCLPMALAHAADVVVQPSAGSSLVVKDSLGGADRFRVQEDGKISIPGWSGLPGQATQMCIDFTLGFIGPCPPPVAGFSLPYSATVNNALTLFDITQSGTGGALRGAITNSVSTAAAISASSAGFGSGVAVQLGNSGNGGRGVDVMQNGVGPGVYAESSGGHAVWGKTFSMSAAGVMGDNPYGEAVVGRAGMGNGGLCGSFGCAGIGAVVGRHDGQDGYGVRGFVTNAVGGIGVIGQVGIGGGTGTAGRFENVNSSNAGDVLVVSGNGAGNLAVFRKGGNVARIDDTGKGFFNGGTQNSGADIAELIDFQGRTPQPGDVVEIDPEHALHYRLSRGSESPMVAGVITTKPGVLMNASIEDATGLPALALAGRVPVKVTLEGGAIRPGDLLVSASLEGHAKRASGAVVPGTVIGKALQSHSGGDKGVVEMLVMTR
ncbi:hypothetical protein G7047_11505 [Diaphorobacter sp. HDW4A]|uniref:hypothetical protein n=1 Tax=Diaphorobacter sp. HDW4A TaxID=2714924 RepID=UPI00140BEE6F|nr:hypothetical protein [Diaphorobacter sp. HDW4A]QIL80457.1 hypothetical protein G7047_11505 [Diaphorobacter sp. HDW4A]